MKFTEETMQSLREYGAVLREIHDRLVKEGKLKKIKGKWMVKENDKWVPFSRKDK